VSFRTSILCLVVLCCTQGIANAQSVTKTTFRALENVQALMEQERYTEAFGVLETLVTQVQNIPYDHALVNQYLAHPSVVLDRPDRARKALETALAEEGLPPEFRADLKLFYGTILLTDEEFAAAASALEDWLAVAPSPNPKQIFNVAYAQYMSGSLPRAEELVIRTFAMAPRPAIPDAWLQVYYRILFDSRKYAEAETLLYELLQRNPQSQQHWRLLASHFLQLEQSNDALAAIMVSYWGGLVRDVEDLRRILSLYGFVDVPEKAAQLLEQWLAENKIPANAEALKQLGNFWLLARERDKAKSALQQAASTSPDGRTYQMLAGIYFEDEDWVAAHTAYQRALRAGGLEEPLRVSLLAGIAAYRAGLKDEARAALRNAATSSRFKSQAESLLKRLDEA